MKKENKLVNAILKNKTLHIKQFAKTDFLIQEMRNVLFRITSERQNADLRTFINSGVRDDLSTIIRKTKYSIEEDFDSWFSQILNSKDYCIVINQIEKWNEKISYFFQEKIINEWTKQLGKQIMGFEVFSFIGKYKHTPFGIHSDQDHTLLINIGPNPIKVWTWEREKYFEICSESDATFGNFEIQKIEKYASIYDFEPSDFIFIPKGVFHVFERKSFSITLGLIPIPFNPKKVLEKFVFKNLSKEILKTNESIDFIKSENYDDFILNYSTQLKNELINIDFFELFQIDKLRLLSNGFINNSFMKEENNKDIARKKIKGLSNKITIYRNTANKLSLHLNGNEVITTNKNCIYDLVEYMNNSKFIYKSKIISILKTEISETSAQYLCNLIFSLI